MIDEGETSSLSECNATNELSKKIEPINRDTVHKICSGQVILNLAVAVKELVENSLDAGATLIEIKLRDQGLELIEVADNGSGVEEENFKGLTAKYHTSKIREFSDLEGVETFGFRGEALSSLCGISDMVITTRHKSSEFGTKLELDYYGVVKRKSPCPREVGTTVTLKNLFSTLPVRKREFAKNVKKEFNRMCQILQGYCLVSKGVRIICTNQNKKGNKTVLMQTNGSNQILDNISAIFGQKQSNELIEIKSPNVLSNSTLLDPDNSNVNDDDIDVFNLSNFQINGWISNINNEYGRSIRDRQFFFINSRPFEPKQIIKLFNETYNKYNANQQPFIFINIFIDRKNIDVNLTPDKRQILINNERMLLLALKQSLLNTFNELTNNYKVDNINIITKNKNIKESIENYDWDDQVKVKPNTQKFSEMLSQWRATGKTDEPCKHLDKPHKRKQSDEITVRSIKMKKIQEYLTQDVSSNEKSINKGEFSYLSENSDNEDEKNVSSLSTQDQEDLFCVLDDLNQINELTPPDSEPQISDNAQCQISDEETKIDCKIEIISDKHEKKLKTETVQSAIKINATIDDIKSLIKIEENFIKTKSNNENNIKLNKLKFKCEIKPNSNKSAEQELNKEIKKNDFLEMKIIGQFNFGFIIVQLNNDLFIIDQHASDEKYNFEMLQKVTKLDTQAMVIPQPLELTAVNELLLIDNLNIFNMNGFTFIIDEEAEPTKKIKLIGKPFSKNWEFGKEDIDELLFMLHDSPNTMCRPSRVRLMFASRACRKSVMIGKPLTKFAMKRLVEHMAELDHPWNCPHGRPTMRHLLNLAMLNSNNK